MLQGSLVAIVTPFLGDGRVDFERFRSLILWHISSGTQGIVVCGTTGESPTLSHEEKYALLDIAVQETKGRVPVIMGTGSYDTHTTVENTRLAKEHRADGCLVIVPYYNKPTFGGCLEHFKRVAAEGLPVVVYHHPGRTGIKLSAQQLSTLCQIDGVCGLKESSGDMDLALEFLRTSSQPLFSGDDTLTLPLIALGAKGVISVVANVIPKEWSEFTHLCLAGNIQKARSLLYTYAPLCKSLFLDSNPQGVKHAMGVMKKIEPHLRLPLMPPVDDIQRKIEKALYDVISL